MVGFESLNFIQPSTGQAEDLAQTIMQEKKVQQYLPDLNFPVNKEEVAASAESNDAPLEMVNRIRQAATDQFNNPDEVLQAVQGRL